MIVTTIGNTKLVIETLKDAEALLDIFNRATLVNKTYDLDYRDFYFVDESEKRISIEITEGGKLNTFEQYQTMIAARKAKEADKAAKAGEAATA